MIMNGIKDFQAPQYVDIVHPDKGFFRVSVEMQMS